MPGIHARPTLAVLLFTFSGGFSFAQEESATDVEAVISIAEQRMAVLRDGMLVEKYKISTSKFGLGDSYGSYKTPLGRHRICDKIGEGLPAGAVIKHRNATGEVLPANARGRDPIVTRILWLEGLEQRNANARSRGIYIHGTVEEDKLGNPVSYGCIRMRSRDVIDTFESLPLGTVVTIQQEKLPHYKRWSEPPAMLMASNKSQPKALANPIADKTVDTEKKVPPEKSETEKPGLKLATAKSTERMVTKTLSHVEALVQSATAKSEEPNPANVPRVSFGGAAALAALKGSILFADLPGQGPKVDGLSAASASLPEPIAENLTASQQQLPRVSFRAPASERVVR